MHERGSEGSPGLSLDHRRRDADGRVVPDEEDQERKKREQELIDRWRDVYFLRRWRRWQW